jgi:hypothetical protein
MKVWFEDSVPSELMESIKKSTGLYTPEKQRQAIESVYAKLIAERKEEFNNILKAQEAVTENK